MPPPPVLKKMHKFAPKTMDGIFLGWEMSPGGRWHGDYLVASTEDFLSGKNHVRVYQVKEVIPPDEIMFPLKGMQAQLEAHSPEEQ